MNSSVRPPWARLLGLLALMGMVFLPARSNRVWVEFGPQQHVVTNERENGGPHPIDRRSGAPGRSNARSKWYARWARPGL